jgi:hypothetical protein
MGIERSASGDLRTIFNSFAHSSSDRFALAHIVRQRAYLDGFRGLNLHRMQEFERGILRAVVHEHEPQGRNLEKREKRLGLQTVRECTYTRACSMWLHLEFTVDESCCHGIPANLTFLLNTIY